MVEKSSNEPVWHPSYSEAEKKLLDNIIGQAYLLPNELMTAKILLLAKEISKESDLSLLSHEEIARKIQNAASTIMSDPIIGKGLLDRNQLLSN